MEINADTRRTSRSGDCSGLGSVMLSILSPGPRYGRAPTTPLATVPQSGADRSAPRDDPAQAPGRERWSVVPPPSFSARRAAAASRLVTVADRQLPGAPG